MTFSIYLLWCLAELENIFHIDLKKVRLKKKKSVKAKEWKPPKFISSHFTSPGSHRLFFSARVVEGRGRGRGRGGEGICSPLNFTEKTQVRLTFSVEKTSTFLGAKYSGAIDWCH